MALRSLRAPALKFDRGLILNLFIAVIAVTTLLLVCYLVFLPSYTRRRSEGRARVPLSEHPILRRNKDEGKVVRDGRHSLLDKIPNFEQSRLLNMAKRPGLPPAGSVDASVLRPVLHPAAPSSPPLLHHSSIDPHSTRTPTPPLRHRDSSQHPKRPPPPPRQPVLPTPPFISLSSIAKQQCQKEYCSESLTSNDLGRWKNCSLSAGINDTRAEPQEGRCRFLDLPNREAVALVSFAGSGNTWVRGLLESATGICTGAVYCDISLRGKGFVGEYTRGSQALVVKTHSVVSEWANARSKMRALRDRSGLFGSAILLVRNPFDALVAEWNRKVSNNFRERTMVLDSHTKAAGREWFENNAKWDVYVHQQMIRWQDVIKNWLLSNNNHYPILVVTYESLKKKFIAEVKRMLDFLKVRYDVDGRLEERLNHTIDAFHRKNHPKDFQHFTTEQRTYVNDVLKDVHALIKSTGKSHLLDVQHYISRS